MFKLIYTIYTLQKSGISENHDIIIDNFDYTGVVNDCFHDH